MPAMPPQNEEVGTGVGVGENLIEDKSLATAAVRLESLAIKATS